MLQFVAIPQHVRRVLLTVAAQRLRVLRKDHAGEEGEEEDDTDEENSLEAILAPVAGGALGETAEMVMSSGQSVATEKDSEQQREAELWSKVFNTAPDGTSLAGAAAPSGRSLGRAPVTAPGVKAGSRRRAAKTYRKSTWFFVLLLGRFCSPLLLLFILFSVVFGKFYVSSATVLSLSAAAVAAGQRHACIVQFMVAYDKFLLARVDPASRSLLFYYAIKTLDCVKNNHALLSYGVAASGLTSNYASYAGSPEDGLPSYLSAASTTAMYQASFGNVCEFLAAQVPGTDAPRCEAFSGGILKLGLSALLNQFYTRGYGLLDQQFRTFYAEGYGQANASGFTLPSDTYPYASRPCLASAKCTPGASLVFQRTPTLPSYLPNASWVGDAPLGDSFFYGSAPSNVRDWIASDDYAFLEEAVKMYIMPVTNAMQEFYVASAQAALQAYLSLVSVFIPAAVTFIVLFLFFWWLPATTRENKAIMSKRAMLLYLPAPVVHNLPGVRDMIGKIIARDGDEALSKGRGGGSNKVVPS